MAGDLQTSSLFLEVMDIQNELGSPYHRLEVIIHAGGQLIQPHQTLRLDNAGRFRTEYTDKLSVVVALGSGTLMNEIGPFKEDLKITITHYPLNGQGQQMTDLPVNVRTYKAYLGDQIARPAESGSNAMLQSTETGNRMISPTTFVLEEVAIAELRKQSFGAIISKTPPIEVVKSVLMTFINALKLATDEIITTFDAVAPSNTTPKQHIVITDGTPVLDIPDVMQNEQGGIYSSGLGFYLRGQGLYLWPLYDTTRFESARKVLRVLLAPNKQSLALDKTWKMNERTITVYSAGIGKIVDDSTGNLNIDGNATRFADAGKLMEDFGSVSGNKLTLNRGANNNEYVSAVVGNGQNYAKVSDTPITSNVYLEASKKARLQGVVAYIPWKRSNPDILIPGLPVEVLYDYNGEIKTLSGVLSGDTSTYSLEGSGPNAYRYQCTTILEIFLDRNDPDYIDYLKNGGTLSAAPEIDAT